MTISSKDNLNPQNHHVSLTLTRKPFPTKFQTVYQLGAEIPFKKMSAQTVYHDVIDTVGKWVETQIPFSLPQLTKRSPTFDIDHLGLQRLQFCMIPEENIWTVRLVQPDMPDSDNKAVAGLNWIFDISVHLRHNQLLFGIRISCVCMDFVEAQIKIRLPFIVSKVIERFGLREVRYIENKPWYLEKSQLRQLYDLLILKNRNLPIIVLTQPNGSHGQVTGFVVNEQRLAKELFGFAHVVCLPRTLEIPWANKVGSIWSVLPNSVRIYFPNIDLQKNSFGNHPHFYPPTIGLEGQKDLLVMLVKRIKEFSVTKKVDWKNWVFYLEAQTRQATLRRQLLKSESEQMISRDKFSELQLQIAKMEEAHSDEITALQNQLKEAAEKIETTSNNYEDRLKQMEQEKQEIQHKNRTLRLALDAKLKSHEKTEIPIPDHFNDMPDWVEQYLSGRLILLSRAKRGIKTARYEDVPLVYESLLLLANSYRNMKLGESGAKEEWEMGLARLGLDFDRSISKERVGQEGEDYFVRYPPDKETTRILEFHLRKGTTRDERYCLRIYFFWDEENQLVVVGWLPSHLDTRGT
jgi:hypothetical protein